jgi:hypothetical protein
MDPPYVHLSRDCRDTLHTCFSRLTRPIVTANLKFMGCKIVALFIDCGCSGVIFQFATALSFADFAAPRNNTVMMS